ncbi:MAG: isoprenylcysteine carboxyl methyltransferase family protein [Rhodospirillaceae bacterium]
MIGLVAAERLIELVISRRHESALRARGAVEIGAGHYPFIVAVHAAWLAGLTVWALAMPPQLNPALAAAYFALQPLRVWVIASLGPYWTTRIISLPSAPLMRGGPYRWLRHPNYTVVVLEIAILPLALGAWPLAILFSVLNAVVLRVRIAAENQTLASRS